MLSLLCVPVCVVLQPTTNNTAHPAVTLHRNTVVGFISLIWLWVLA
jgi:hypothetical protein